MESYREAKALGVRTAFLCHSHADKLLAQGLVSLLRGAGVTLYVDWLDPTMPSTPNRETAEGLQLRIRRADWFLFLATAASLASRWCPWEIGFADGVKPLDAIFVLPTSADDGSTHGNEYLQLYRRIDLAVGGDLAVIEPGRIYGRSLKAL